MVKYSWKLKKLCDMLSQKIKNDYDAIVVIDGHTGIGKSTLAIQIARRVKTGEFFHIKKDLVYSQEEFLSQMRKKSYGKIIADEMINVGFARDWYNKKQKDIIKTLNMNRDHNNLIILCVPNFADLDKKIINMCRMRLTVVERGIAIVQLKNQSLYSADKWDMLVNSKIEREILNKKKRFNPHDYTKLTTFAGFVKFKDLPPTIKAEYRKIKEEKRAKLISEIERLKEKKKEPYLRIEEALLKGEVYNKQDMIRLCNILGLEYQKTYDKIRRKWKKQDIKETPREFFVDRIVKTEKQKILEEKESLKSKMKIDYAEEIRKARERAKKRL